MERFCKSRYDYELARKLFCKEKRQSMAMKKELQNKNGSEKLPRAKDFKLPEKLTKDQQELIEATREVMKALKEEQAKYGKKTYL